jgi:hypothetical protein
VFPANHLSGAAGMRVLHLPRVDHARLVATVLERAGCARQQRMLASINHQLMHAEPARHYSSDVIALQLRPESIARVMLPL